MGPSPAFSAATALHLHNRRLRSSLLRRAPRCQAQTPQRNATLFSTGEKLALLQAPPVSPLTPRYIVCPECASAYVGNSVTTTVRVACPSCKVVFNTSPTDLYIVAPDAPPPPRMPNAIVCDHMRVCSGCTQSQNLENPPMLVDARDFLTRTLRLPSEPTVELGPTHEWRTHSKLAVRRGTQGERLSLGLFKSHSHDVIPIPACAVHAVEIQRASEITKSVLSDGNILPYDERSGNGLIRYVLFTVERASRLVQVTLVWNAASWKDGSPIVQKLGSELWYRGRGVLHSVWFNWNTSSGNAIVNPEPERFYHMFGERHLSEQVCEVPLTFPPYVFRQANLDAFETQVMPRLLNYIPTGSNVAEFCAGVGVIGLVALKQRRLSRLVASEIHRGAEDEFWRTVTKLRRSGVKANVDFIVGSDEETFDDMVYTDVDVAIFDPPRSGLSEYVTQNLQVLTRAAS